MFRRLLEPDAPHSAPVAIEIDGQTFLAREGDSVATAMLLADRLEFRMTPNRGVPRGPYCMIGACFDCLVAIDGRPNQQACQIAVAPGMRIDTKPSPR